MVKFLKEHKYIELALKLGYQSLGDGSFAVPNSDENLVGRYRIEGIHFVRGVNGLKADIRSRDLTEDAKNKIVDKTIRLSFQVWAAIGDGKLEDIGVTKVSRRRLFVEDTDVSEISKPKSQRRTVVDNVEKPAHTDNGREKPIAGTDAKARNDRSETEAEANKIRAEDETLVVETETVESTASKETAQDKITENTSSEPGEEISKMKQVGQYDPLPAATAVSFPALSDAFPSSTRRASSQQAEDAIAQSQEHYTTPHRSPQDVTTEEADVSQGEFVQMETEEPPTEADQHFMTQENNADEVDDDNSSTGDSDEDGQALLTFLTQDILT